jgi:hypothetical protein
LNVTGKADPASGQADKAAADTLQDYDSLPDVQIVEPPTQFGGKAVLGGAELRQLLLCCASMHTEQLKGVVQLKLELFECLLGRAKSYSVVGASVGQLVAALIDGFLSPEAWAAGGWLRPAGSSTPHRNTGILHPVLQLLNLPWVQKLGPESVYAVLEAGIQDRSNVEQGRCTVVGVSARVD